MLTPTGIDHGPTLRNRSHLPCPGRWRPARSKLGHIIECGCRGGNGGLASAVSTCRLPTLRGIKLTRNIALLAESEGRTEHRSAFASLRDLHARRHRSASPSHQRFDQDRNRTSPPQHRLNAAAAPEASKLRPDNDAYTLFPSEYSWDLPDYWWNERLYCVDHITPTNLVGPHLEYRRMLLRPLLFGTTICIVVQGN